MKELVIDNHTGLLFNPGDAKDLMQKIDILSKNTDGIRVWGKEARRMFENKFLSRNNYEKLISLYQRVKISAKTIPQP